jgi:hypothetical protein
MIEKENIVMDYIAIWNWHIIAIIFLVSSLTLVSLSKELIALVFFFAFLVAFIMCEIMAYMKRVRLKAEEFTEELDEQTG